MICHFILYVSNQTKSTTFYQKVLGMTPTLNVPGMTEFKLNDKCILGLMSSSGIKKLLGNAIKNPEDAKGIPRAEIYLRVPDPKFSFSQALNAGARELSPVEPRDWGMNAGYVQDLDGHVVAFSD